MNYTQLTEKKKVEIDILLNPQIFIWISVLSLKTEISMIIICFMFPCKKGDAIYEKMETY